jgi:hypothetical protein
LDYLDIARILARLPMRAPLSCTIVDQHAVRYFFAGVARDLHAGMERHFAHCARCRRKLRLFERVWRWDGKQRAIADQDGLSLTDDAATMSGLSTCN